jgi:PAS domain S-box-containing protein
MLVPLFGNLSAVAFLMAAAWRFASYGTDLWAIGMVAVGGILLARSCLRQSQQMRAGEVQSIRQSAEISRLKNSAEKLRRDVELRTSDLTESNQHLRTLFDRSALGLLVMDPNDAEVPMRIVDCNDMTCRMHGYEREELLGQSLKKIDATYVERKNVRVFLDGIREQKRVHGEAVHVRKDGTTFPIEFATCVL